MKKHKPVQLSYFEAVKSSVVFITRESSFRKLANKNGTIFVYHGRFVEVQNALGR